MVEPAQARVVWDPSLTAYDFGPSHPMSPIRLDLTARLCQEFGLFDTPVNAADHLLHAGVAVISIALGYLARGSATIQPGMSH